MRIGGMRVLPCARLWWYCRVAIPLGGKLSGRVGCACSHVTTSIISPAGPLQEQGHASAGTGTGTCVTAHWWHARALCVLHECLLFACSAGVCAMVGCTRCGVGACAVLSGCLCIVPCVCCPGSTAGWLRLQPSPVGSSCVRHPGAFAAWLRMQLRALIDGNAFACPQREHCTDRVSPVVPCSVVPCWRVHVCRRLCPAGLQQCLLR
jgi:hypothetical protein